MEKCACCFVGIEEGSLQQARKVMKHHTPVETSPRAVAISLRRLAAIAIAALSICLASATAKDAISLYQVDPSIQGRIPTNTLVEFRLRIQIDTLHAGGLWVYNNGFRLYSPDGAEWDTTYARYLYGWLPFGDQSVWPVNTDGIGADTVIFFGEDSAGGFWVVYDDDTWAIQIFIPDTPGIYGKTICLDTVSDSIGPWPYSTWFWTTLYGEVYQPEWDVPHCFTIGCCDGDGMRGNVDYITGPGGEVDIADVTFLAQYLFIGYWLPCFAEGNVDGQESLPDIEVDVHDLTYLIQYLFFGGPPPAPCPQ